MKLFRNNKLNVFFLGMLLAAVIALYLGITGGFVSGDAGSAPDCRECAKTKAKSFSSVHTGNSKTAVKKGGSNFFLKFFSSVISSGGEFAAETIPGDDPVKDAAVNELNALSKVVCNEENLPEDIWISPTLMEEDPNAHIKELEKLIQYCKGLKNGAATPEQKKEYYTIKKRLLEERRELIKYYLETLDGQIEDMKEKQLADRGARKAGDAITPEEEKINAEIETESNKFYRETVAGSTKMIDMINAAIKKYPDMGSSH